ncbi:MAG: hypothetical protein ACK57E_08430 [Erythrobacteraceae bacterium]
MKRGHHSKAEKQRRIRGARRSRPTVRAHALFVPILAIWGALLGGLVTLALPAGAVLAAAANIGLGALDEMSRFILAGVAALVIGSVMLVIGRLLVSKAEPRKDMPSIASMVVRQVHKIDPASELGSDSFDAPVEAMPFAVAEAQREPVAKLAPEPEPVVLAEVTNPAPASPQELDLAQFAALEGRNAVWIEEPVAAAAPSLVVPEPAPAPAPVPAPAPEPATIMRRAQPRPPRPSAIERLRAVPPSELSLVQMVERFAAALHEHQSTPAGSTGLAARDAALAEALKALAVLSRDSEAQTQSEPVRAALGRLQELRGGA